MPGSLVVDPSLEAGVVSVGVHQSQVGVQKGRETRMPKPVSIKVGLEISMSMPRALVLRLEIALSGP